MKSFLISNPTPIQFPHSPQIQRAAAKRLREETKQNVLSALRAEDTRSARRPGTALAATFLTEYHIPYSTPHIKPRAVEVAAAAWGLCFWRGSAFRSRPRVWAQRPSIEGVRGVPRGLGDPLGPLIPLARREADYITNSHEDRFYQS